MLSKIVIQSLIFPDNGVVSVQHAQRSILTMIGDYSPVCIPEYAIANVQCQYDSPSDTEDERVAITVATPTEDHNYNSRDEPPAFIIQQKPIQPLVSQLEQRSKIMTLAPAAAGYSTVNVIHVGDQPPNMSCGAPELGLNRRIRRSEAVLRQAAACVSRGLTFQTVSEQFNIPISTIRFFMARKGILPRRRRGRSTQARPSSSPEPPFHMQHYKLPDMLALRQDDDGDDTLQ